VSKALHQRLARAGKRPIEKNGRLITFITFTETGDDIEPTRTPVELPSVKAVNVGFDGKEGPQLQAETDIVFLVHGLVETRPDKTMRLKDSIDGIDYSIKAIRTIVPGEVFCLFRVYGAV